MQEYSKEAATIIEQLHKNQSKVIITVHQSPDGDALGSAIGLHLILKKNNISSHIIVPDEFPDFLKWLPASEDIIIYETSRDLCQGVIQKSDVLFLLDFNQWSRLKGLEEFLKQPNFRKTILIDHHQNPQITPDIKYIDTEASSTCELVFRIIEKNGLKSQIDADCATALFCGIMTDTGSFRFPSATWETFNIASFLVKQGADHAKIHQKVYDTYSESRLRLLGYVLKEKMEVIASKNAAIIALSNEELKRYNYKKGDTEGFVNYPLSIESVMVSVLVTEKENGEVKISFRSKGKIDVQKIAAKYFNGGGHINAAGANSPYTLEKTVDEIKKIIMAEL